MSRWHDFAAKRPQRESPLYTQAEEIPVTFWTRDPSTTPGGWHHPTRADVPFGNNLPPLHIDGKGDVVPMVGRVYAYDRLDLNGLDRVPYSDRLTAFETGKNRVEVHFKTLSYEEVGDRLGLEPLLDDNGDQYQMYMWTFPNIKGRLLFLHGAMLWGVRGGAMESVGSPTDLLQMVAERRMLELLEGRLELKAAGVTSFSKFVTIGQWGEGGHRFGRIKVEPWNMTIDGGGNIKGFYGFNVHENTTVNLRKLLYFVDGKRYSFERLTGLFGTFFGIQYQDATEEPPGLEFGDFMVREAEINESMLLQGTPGPAVLHQAVFLPRIRLREHSFDITDYAGAVSIRVTPEKPMAGLRMREALLECDLDLENSVFALWQEQGTVMRNLTKFFVENGRSLKSLLGINLLYFSNNYYMDGKEGHPHFPVELRNHPTHGSDQGMSEFYKFFLNNMDLSGHWADLGEFRKFPEREKDAREGVAFAIGTHIIFLTRLIEQLKKIEFFSEVTEREWDRLLSIFVRQFAPNFRMRVSDVGRLNIANFAGSFRWGSSRQELVARITKVADNYYDSRNRGVRNEKKARDQNSLFDRALRSIIEQWKDYYESRLEENMENEQWSVSRRDAGRRYRKFPNEYFIPKAEQDLDRLKEIIEAGWKDNGLNDNPKLARLKELLLALMQAGMTQSETVELDGKDLTLRQAFWRFNKAISGLSRREE